MTEPSRPPDPADPAIRALGELIARVAEALRAGGDDAAVRTQAAVEVERLRAIVGEAGAQRVPGFDLAAIARALRVFAAWLAAPTPENEAAAERAMSDLAATVGPLVGWDPAREDAARRAQYRREARAALDEIFGGKPEKP